MKLPHHGRYGYSCITDRADYSWPQGRRLALYVCVAVEQFAFGAGLGEDIAVVGAAQTHRNYGWRDYGQRVGLWRLLDMLDGLQLPVALAVNGMAVGAQPDLVERLRRRGDEIIGYGRTSSESPATMWVDDELAAIGQTTRSLEEGFGRRPLGWATPGIVESSNTVDLLVREGYRYVLDWPADDQPFWLQARTGRILSVPFPVDTNDITMVAHRHHSGREFADMIVGQFEEMARQSDDRSLVLPVVLHPYIAGQPFRLRPLRQALAHCLQGALRDKVWLTRPGEIASHCASLPAGIIP